MCARTPTPTPGRDDRIDQLNGWIEQYGKDHGLQVVDYHSVLVARRQPVSIYLTVDGVHPNASGYAVMAPVVEHAIAADQRKVMPGHNGL
jgi:lysophospholipase L1-like esterase